MNKEEIQLAINLYKNGYSATKIKEYLPYSQHTILKYIKLNGAKIRSKAGYKKPFNENFFSNIDTEEKAYFLGLLMADGNVMEREKSQPLIRIELNRKDKHIIKYFKQCLKTENKIEETAKNCCALRIHSSQMFSDLKKYGIVPNKTGHEVLPKTFIPENLIHHFVRGFFDGDGWVTNTHHGNRKNVLNIGFCGGKSIVLSLNNFFFDKLKTKKLSVCDRGTWHCIIYGSQSDVLKIYNFMYKDATIYLTRKKECFQSFYANTEQA